MPNSVSNGINIIINEKRDLNEDEAYSALNEIMLGQAIDDEIASLLTCLADKGESVSEINGMAKVMQEQCLKIGQAEFPLLDTCGTGGAEIKTFNVSTASAFVASAAGANVAKHGNRAMTSKSGSADFLEALGAKIDLDPNGVSQCLKNTGIGFMFAQSFHPAMKYVAHIRKSLGFRTIFNLLGPLTNPAQANCRILGTGSIELAEKMATALTKMDIRHGLVVTGEEGIDEISIMGKTHIFEIKNHELSSYFIHPSDFGLNTYDIKKVASKSPNENAEIFRNILSGNGPIEYLDFICINAGAALYTTGHASSIGQGIDIAKTVIDNGDVAAKVAAFIDHTQKNVSG
ncbi:MAG: anthranilate phosphoribosyltransferase [Dehalococcoidaceae bacterium]|nr:anthranilate phosphoribosyltransferase [Dehalococcoidaceae bacterium]